MKSLGQVNFTRSLLFFLSNCVFLSCSKVLASLLAVREMNPSSSTSLSIMAAQQISTKEVCVHLLL